MEAFFVYIVSSLCIELSLLATTLNNLFSERGTYFLTRTEVVKATHGFKHSVAMKQNPSTLEQSIFCLLVVKKLSILHSGFVRWKQDVTIFIKASCLVLSSCKPTGLCIEVPMRIRTGGHGLTYPIWIQLASINPNSWFAYVCRLSKKSFINNYFACKNDRRTTNNMFPNFLQQLLTFFREWIEICISRIV